MNSPLADFIIYSVHLAFRFRHRQVFYIFSVTHVFLVDRVLTSGYFLIIIGNILLSIFVSARTSGSGREF